MASILGLSLTHFRSQSYSGGKKIKKIKTKQKNPPNQIPPESTLLALGAKFNLTEVTESFLMVSIRKTLVIKGQILQKYTFRPWVKTALKKMAIYEQAGPAMQAVKTQTKFKEFPPASKGFRHCLNGLSRAHFPAIFHEVVIKWQSN